MKKLIITADDYGMSPSVNMAIKECINSGVINSINVMPVMDYCDDPDLKDLKFKNPNLSLGLHWTLTAGFPLCDRDEIPSLADAKGRFWSYPEFRRRYRKGIISDEEIRKELTAQYNKYVSIYGQPDYWNTHQNVHVDFRIFNVFTKTAIDLKINKMRSHDRVYVPAKGKATLTMARRIIEPVKRLVLKYWLYNAHKLGMSFPDGLITPLSDDDKLDIGYMFENISWNNRKIAELIIHPAVKNDSEYFGKITDKRIKEYHLFKDPEVIQIGKKNKIRLCGFEEV